MNKQFEKKIKTEVAEAMEMYKEQIDIQKATNKFTITAHDFDLESVVSYFIKCNRNQKLFDKNKEERNNIRFDNGTTKKKIK